MDEYTQNLEKIMSHKIGEGMKDGKTQNCTEKQWIRCSAEVVEQILDDDRKMSALVDQVRGEGLLGLFQEVGEQQASIQT